MATQKTGRVRITLTDGSILNLGAGSTMHIVEHDAQSQQTVIELTSGRLRTEVSKRTQPGGKFETRTPTAVIAVVGTTLITQVVNPNTTEVFSDEGDVEVSNVDPNISGSIVLHAGQSTSGKRGRPPTFPINLAPQQKTQQTNSLEGRTSNSFYVPPEEGKPLAKDNSSQ